MRKHTNQPTAVDLFAGAGGLAEGLLAAGIDVAVAVESHPHPALTHAFNHPGTTVLCGDIRKITARQIRDQLKKNTGRRQPDIVVGGPPCQGFSVAGKRNRTDPRNKLLEQYVRLISQLNPQVFVFENVPGLYKLYGGRTLYRLLDQLWHLGYRFYGMDNDDEYYPTQYPTFVASEFGVPQKRRRLVLIGSKCERIEELKFARRSGKAVSVESAIGDLSFLHGGLETHEYQIRATTAYQRSRRSNSGFLFNHLTTKHRKETVSAFKHFKPGDTVNCLPARFRTKKQRVLRLRPNDVAPAVLALPDDYIHPSLNRILTVREMARLQSFDDDYVFFGKRTTSDKNRRVDVPQYTQVGNAVPPLLARALGIAILNVLNCDSVDIRNLKERRIRHEWIVGSSSFHGYELLPDAAEQIDLIPVKTELPMIPISTDGCPISLGESGIEDWTKRRSTGFGRAA